MTRSVRWLLAAIVAAGSVVPPSLAAQQRPPAPVRPGAPAPRPDTTRRLPGDTLRRAGTDSLGRPGGAAGDTTRPRELVEWLPTDSTLDALLQKPGYQATRYQGRTVVFDAAGKVLELRGAPGARAAVSRGRTILVGDTVRYDDQRQSVDARGDTVILRDPDQNQSDLVAGRIRYDLEASRGTIQGLSTTVENGGEKWVVFGHQAAVVNLPDSLPGDSVARTKAAVYARGGTITSCDLAEPHYHFEAREMKVVTRGLLVARPAVLYIADVPVFWLPFIFQDMRRDDRRSGILTPRFGVSELVRNNPNYRRTVENLGYFFALNDYTDVLASVDWRSGSRPTEGDPGFLRLNGEFRYRLLTRFAEGRLGYSRLRQYDGQTSENYALAHRQQFSARSALNANLNFARNTTLIPRVTFDPRSTVASIQSQANYTNAFGPFALSLGGSQQQFPGRTQINRTFPTLSVTAQPVNLADWLVWTPAFNLNTQQTINGDFAQGIAFRFVPNAAGGVDSVQRKQNSRQTGISLETPLRIFNFVLPASFRYNDQLNDVPQSRIVLGDRTAPLASAARRDTSVRDTVIFARTFRTDLDFTTGISLPPFLQGSWNFVPSVSLENIDPGALLVRTELSGGRWVSQGKRAVFGLGASPNLFGLFPGFGPVTRFRHSISPTLNYGWTYKAEVSDEYLEALGRTRLGYLGSQAQSRVSLGLSQNLEAKLRGAPGDTTEGGRKIRLLSLQFSSLSYDFERARILRDSARRQSRPTPKWYSGLVTDRVSVTARSDAIPGIDFGMDFSLFQGSTLSDTAEFSPFRESVRASLSLDPSSPVFRGIARLFGVRPSDGAPAAPVGTQPPGGKVGNNDIFDAPPVGRPIRPQQTTLSPSGAWRASFTFSSTRTRPPRGGNAIFEDNEQRCRRAIPLATDPTGFNYAQCLANPASAPQQVQPENTTAGGPIFVPPPITNLSWNYSFNLTQKWAAQWSTSYDFEGKQFAAHIVSLQRELHDWNATFGFTQSPNGNVFFNFFISLKAEPDLKFNFDRNTYGQGGR